MRKSIIALCMVAGINNSYAETSDTQSLRCKADLIVMINLSTNAEVSGYLCLDQIIKYGQGQPIPECNIATIKINSLYKSPLRECNSISMMNSGLLLLNDTQLNKLIESGKSIKNISSIIKEYNSYK